MGIEMSDYLIIETSTEKGLIACIQNQQVVFVKELPCGLNQSKFLMPELEAYLQTYQIKLSNLSFIGVGVGPGSYTGIRVGVAVAQSLAFSWNLPVVGVPSLNGFVPKNFRGSFAALIDARVAGAYVLKGIQTDEGIVYLAEPEVCPLEQLPEYLKEITHLVTPLSQSLQAKLTRLFPHQTWQWEERFPCIEALSKSMEAAYKQGRTSKAGELNLLYLRETEAEREKDKKQNLRFTKPTINQQF